MEVSVTETLPEQVLWPHHENSTCLRVHRQPVAANLLMVILLVGGSFSLDVHA